MKHKMDVSWLCDICSFISFGDWRLCIIAALCFSLSNVSIHQSFKCDIFIWLQVCDILYFTFGAVLSGDMICSADK